MSAHITVRSKQSSVIVKPFVRFVSISLALLGSLRGATTGWQVPPQPAEITWDFETGDLRGWQSTGNAFRYQPTRGDNPTARNRGQPSNHVGRYWIGTFERYQSPDEQPGTAQGDPPIGTLTSLAFVLPGGTLSFLIGGGRDDATRVELVIIDPIDGDFVAEQASGAQTESMGRVTWDLGRFAGREARIRIVDEARGPWGHINVDDFIFSAWATRVPDLRGQPQDRAVAILREYRLQAGQVGLLPSFARAGTVVEQSPEPGTPSMAGNSVHFDVAVTRQPTITVPPGVQPRTVVPDLDGAPEEVVQEMLAESELQLGQVTREAAFGEPGTVFQQSPEPGTEAYPGDRVSVRVVDPQLVVVPRLLELHIEDAIPASVEAALRPADPEAQPSNAPEGTVIDQDPEPGDTVPAGTTVNLRFAVARPEPALVEVPRFIDQTWGRAQLLADRAGLELVAGNPVPALLSAGTVFAQSPQSGFLVPEGSTVTVQLAAQPPPSSDGPRWIPFAGGIVLALAAALGLARVARRRTRSGGADARLLARVVGDSVASAIDSPGDTIAAELRLRANAGTDTWQLEAEGFSVTREVNEDDR